MLERWPSALRVIHLTCFYIAHGHGTHYMTYIYIAHAQLMALSRHYMTCLYIAHYTLHIRALLCWEGLRVAIIGSPLWYIFMIHIYIVIHIYSPWSWHYMTCLYIVHGHGTVMALYDLYLYSPWLWQSLYDVPMYSAWSWHYMTRIYIVMAPV